MQNIKSATVVAQQTHDLNLTTSLNANIRKGDRKPQEKDVGTTEHSQHHALGADMQAESRGVHTAL